MAIFIFQSLHKSSGYSDSFRVTGGGGPIRPIPPNRNGNKGNNNNNGGSRPYEPYPSGEEVVGPSDPVSATPAGDKNLMIIIIVCACAGVTVIIIGCAVLVVYMR